MDAGDFECPASAFRYNGTLCACPPGSFMRGGLCAGIGAGTEWEMGGGRSEGAAPRWFEPVPELEPIERMVSSEAALMKATAAVVVLWVVFCVAVRLGRVRGGRSFWFRCRCWIERLDLRFATKHLLDDQKVVKKRKTELGGMFSVASWILFVGLLTTLLYQFITKRSIEVHRVKPAKASELKSFNNDMEFNITTLSSMSCSHLRGFDTLVIGTPGSIDYKISPLLTYANYSCYDTIWGPTISLKCSSCQVLLGNHYISWQFVDLPNSPAMAVGFQFNITAKDHACNKHVSFVSGTLKSESLTCDGPKTFRGPDMSILKIHLFPQKFKNLHNLQLIQPLLHDFLPGSSFSDVIDLRASLQSSLNGVVNTVLYIRYLSDYIVETDKENLLGLVGFFADAGGLYAITLAIFLYFLLQCEARIKKLQCEDSVMRDIRSQRRAQRHWDKLRKYVKYTWGRSNLVVKSRSRRRHISLRIGSFHECSTGGFSYWNSQVKCGM
ncbi:uncharacterized protein LOC120275513 isoform X2 [Dioscorea cayenensis subsp. rotundata]|uniref:Uncharacterized protein LOC120275513 isoform X2 n=1 Tax=Dioscorea cayennensis subsp. rotundata TaxID=55577 RepID=A0AB40CDR0_DIOCR|nr:uncharacterized protein LOC120275513 isoform X2 [Dioscorea cayenensis subsp. rotundata]